MHKFDLTSGLSDLTSKQFYYVKVQSIPSQANFVLTRGMSLQPWSLQGGIPVMTSYCKFDFIFENRIHITYNSHLDGLEAMVASKQTYRLREFGIYMK